MELLQLKYFCSVAQLESMTEAARKHAVPQSAMSKTIIKLESELGTKLFDRIGNRIYLNESGKLFLTHVQNSLRELNNAVEMLGDEQDSSGEIRLLVLENRRWITDCIVEFHKLYPQISFSICHNIYEQSHSEFDLYISSSYQNEEEYSWFNLKSERIMLAVNNENPLAKQESVNLSDLADEKFIFLPEKNIINKMMMQKCREAGFEPQISIVCDDPYYVRKYISAGFGISFTPAESWNGLYDDNIVLLPINDANTVRNTAICWPKKRYVPKQAMLFRDFLLYKAQLGV